ncbi:MAG: hypothetical protein BWY86_01211 [Candidatus Aminicenantes bacterium ADurb.Bin508]|nr:MAG: hypothetical protein BWY86_01211 [Candidatus Aminicenantes bacterium ADurb.Bin508]
MNDTRPQGRANGGDLRVDGQQGVDKSVVGVAGSRMDDQTCGFVYNEKPLVFVENRQGDRLRGQGGIRTPLRKPNLDGLTAL